MGQEYGDSEPPLNFIEQIQWCVMSRSAPAVTRSSACVQMPSLPLVQQAEDEFGLPVLSAATAGAFTLLDQLGLPVDLPGAGRLLARDAKVGA